MRTADNRREAGGEVGASSGDLGASSSAFKASSDDLGASSSDFEASSGDLGASSSAFKASSGDLGASSSDFETSSGDLGASSGDFEASSGDLGASSGDFEASSGDLEASSGNLEASSDELETSLDELAASLGNWTIHPAVNLCNVTPMAKNKAKKDSPPEQVSAVQAAKNPFPELPAEAQTLGTLQQILGAPNSKLRRILFRNAKEDPLAQEGADVDSSNIVDDMVRFVVSALTILASLDERRRQLIKLPPGIFAIVIDETQTLAPMKEAHDLAHTTTAAGKIDRETLLRNEMREGIALRELTTGALTNALSTEQLTTLARLVGDASSADKLAQGLIGVAKFIDDILKGGNQDDIDSLEAFGVDALSAQALREKASKVKEAGTAVAAQGRRVTQRQLDIQDGRVLWLVDMIVRAFKLAKRSDNSILLPELNKIAWKFYDVRSSAVKAKKGAEKKEPATGDAPTTGDAKEGEDKPQ